MWMVYHVGSMRRMTQLPGMPTLFGEKNIQNYRFLEEDSFDLDLMEESFGGSDYIDRLLARKQGMFKNGACLDASYLLKDGSYIKAKFLVKGSQYFLLAGRSKDKAKNFQPFFESFSFIPYRYSGLKTMRILL